MLQWGRFVQKLCPKQVLHQRDSAVMFMPGKSAKEKKKNKRQPMATGCSWWQLVAADGSWRQSPKDQGFGWPRRRTLKNWVLRRREEEEKRKRNGERGRKRLNWAAWIWSHEYVSFWYLMSCSCMLSVASWNHNIPDISWLGEEQGWGLGREATKKRRLDKKDENRWEKYGNITWTYITHNIFHMKFIEKSYYTKQTNEESGCILHSHRIDAGLGRSPELSYSATLRRHAEIGDVIDTRGAMLNHAEPCWTNLRQRRTGLGPWWWSNYYE